MTNFNTALIDTDNGGYMMYNGTYEGQPTYQQPCHPTRSGQPIPLFIARFKHRRPTKRWVKFLANNFTVEEYAALIDAGEAPLNIMRSKGYAHFN